MSTSDAGARQDEKPTGEPSAAADRGVTTQGPEPSTPPRTGPDTAGSAREFVNRLLEVESSTILMAVVALALIVGVLHPDFLTFTSLTGVVQQSSYIAILAVGMAFLVAMREIDLSIGGTFELCMVAGAIFMRDGMDPWLAAVIAILIGGACGLLNAIFVELIKLPTIVATLATMSMYSGLALAIGSGQQIIGFSTTTSFFKILGGNIGGDSGLPIVIPILIVVVIVFTVVLRLTPFGYRVRSIGSNPEAAAFSGIRVARVRTQTLVLMGLLAGFSAMLGLAYFETGDPNIGNPFALEVIAAAIIGGTPLRGGTATIAGAAFGAILLGVVTAGLAYFNVSTNSSQFFTGLVILFAVSLDSLMRRRRRAREGGLTL